MSSALGPSDYHSFYISHDQGRDAVRGIEDVAVKWKGRTVDVMHKTPTGSEEEEEVSYDLVSKHHKLFMVINNVNDTWKTSLEKAGFKLGSEMLMEDLKKMKFEVKDKDALELIDQLIDKFVLEQKEYTRDNPASIALGVTDLGRVDRSTGQYTVYERANLKSFAMSLKDTQCYGSWEEFGHWRQTQTVDWADVMYRRFDRTLEMGGHIHFNLSGIPEDDIRLATEINSRLLTGSTHKQLYDSGIGVAKVVGNHKITVWELAQILNSRTLFDKTKFYYYDRELHDDEGPRLLDTKELEKLGIKRPMDESEFLKK